jgi:hypothetical protein
MRVLCWWSPPGALNPGMKHEPVGRGKPWWRLGQELLPALAVTTH